jgi:succinyl-CoA synthetase beta subunit
VNIHEYQAKELLVAQGIPVPMGEVATTPEEAEAIARRLGGTVVIKAQVHTGGRGKAGGVKLAKTPEEARRRPRAILGMQIKGLTVQKVLVAPAEDIASEAYVGIILDRASKAPVWMVRPPAASTSRRWRPPTPEKIPSSRSTRATASCRTRPTSSATSLRRRQAAARRPRRSCSSSTARSWRTARRWPRSTR